MPKYLAEQLQRQSLAKERDENLTSVVLHHSGSLKTYKPDHEYGSTSHDLLVAVSSDEISCELQSDYFADVRPIGDWGLSECGKMDLPALCHGAVMEGSPSTIWLPNVLLKDPKPRYEPICT